MRRLPSYGFYCPDRNRSALYRSSACLSGSGHTVDTKNGGLSESRRIAWLAHDHNVQVVPHGWNTAVGLAADLQFSAAIPVARYVEYLTPCAYIDAITTAPLRLDDDGLLMIPQLPGLGVELDADKLARFCPERLVFS